MDQDKEETQLPKASPTDAASANHGASDRRPLVSIPVHTVDVPVSFPQKIAMDQQQTSLPHEHKLDTRAVGKPRDREADEALPPEESDNLLDHEVMGQSSNEEDSDNEPVSFIWRNHTIYYNYVKLRNTQVIGFMQLLYNVYCFGPINRYCIYANRGL